MDERELLQAIGRMMDDKLSPIGTQLGLSLIHISEPTRLGMISYAVFCLKKKNNSKPTRQAENTHAVNKYNKQKIDQK